MRLLSWTGRAIVVWLLVVVKLVFWPIVVYVLLVRTLFGDGYFLAFLAFYAFVACPILAAILWRKADRAVKQKTEQESA